MRVRTIRKHGSHKVSNRMITACLNLHAEIEGRGEGDSLRFPATLTDIMPSVGSAFSISDLGAHDGSAKNDSSDCGGGVCGSRGARNGANAS